MTPARSPSGRQELGIAPGFEVLVGPARRGEAETREWTYVRKDRSRLAVQLTVTAVLDEDGQPQGLHRDRG